MQGQSRAEASAGPVCEGRETGLPPKASVQFQQVDDAELAQRAKSVTGMPAQEKPVPKVGGGLCQGHSKC